MDGEQGALQAEELRREALRGPPVIFRMARVFSLGGGSPSPSPGITGCPVTVCMVRFLDAGFPLASGTQTITTGTADRTTSSFPAAVPASLSVSPNDIVSIATSNNQWWVLKRYTNCPRNGSPSPSPSPGGEG